MVEDGIAHREPVLTGEASYRSPRGDRERQEGTQGQPKRCEVADESVVVMKFRPVKAGNRLEDKTGTTCSTSTGAGHCQKRGQLRREEVYLNIFGNWM